MFHIFVIILITNYFYNIINLLLEMDIFERDGIVKINQFQSAINGLTLKIKNLELRNEELSKQITNQRILIEQIKIVQNMSLIEYIKYKWKRRNVNKHNSK
jgi:hypothetical protein